jgi:hypothetical protein
MKAERGPLFTRPIETPSICDICGRGRGHGDHRKCSRERQKRNAHKWQE